ncbi:MAG: hypothetical protein OEX04_03855 [Acidimicrobiia bacterium]|nr:hypothetical protein [Acidimicrobiia bacterium]MDH5294713.1 hypothetical protein [Acidimicrobiia bacterium]
MKERSSHKMDFNDVWKLVLAVVGVIAVVQELRKPREARTWNGKVLGVVPYDFRWPTVARVKDTYWNPDGPIISGRVWGAGWAPNLGAITKRMKRR